MINLEIQNAATLEDVVQIVNSAGAAPDEFGYNDYAAHYAVFAADEYSNIEELEAHLTVLADAGADFDFGIAVDLAHDLAIDIKLLSA